MTDLTAEDLEYARHLDPYGGEGCPCESCRAHVATHPYLQTPPARPSRALPSREPGARV
jgi:hypothetical protein